jgi:hypothetical protein
MLYSAECLPNRLVNVPTKDLVVNEMFGPLHMRQRSARLEWRGESLPDIRHGERSRTGLLQKGSAGLQAIMGYGRALCCRVEALVRHHDDCRDSYALSGWRRRAHPTAPSVSGALLALRSVPGSIRLRAPATRARRRCAGRSRDSCGRPAPDRCVVGF